MAVLISGCAAPRRHAALPVWIEAAHLIPAASEAPPMPAPDGWQPWPFAVVQCATSPFGITNALGAPITWFGRIEFDPATVPTSYRVEYLSHDFGPSYYPLFTIQQTGAAVRVTVPIEWTQIIAPEFRLLKQITP